MSGSTGARQLGITIIAVLALVGCGSAATPSPSHTVASPAPATGRASASAPGQAASQAPLPSGSSDPDRFARFKAHVAASGTVVAALLEALPFDVSTNNAAAVTKDATALQAWAAAEADWMTANPYAACYGGAYTNWDTVRVHAAKAASTALAGNYDQLEGSFAVSQYKKLAELMPQVHC